MKRLLLLLSATIIFCLKVNAQTLVASGNDTTGCSGELFYIGGFPTASGGTPPYTYAWSPWNGEIDDTTSSNPSIGTFWYGGFDTVLTYYLTVTDFLGAQAFDTVRLTLHPGVGVQLGSDTTICAGDSIRLGRNIVLLGGTAPLSYAWTNGAGNVANPMVAPAFTINYSIVVTDVNGCSATDMVNVAVSSCGFQVITLDVRCNGACDGSAEVVPLGNYHYLWSVSDTTQTITNLCPGLPYSVTVSDSVYNPLDTVFFNIYEPTALVINGTVHDACIGSSNGSIDVTVSGGVSPYTFSWSNGLTTEDAFGLAAGTYSLTLTDANACTATASFTVNQSNTPPSVTINSSDETICGACDGSATAIVTGGTPGYTFVWSNGSVTMNQTNLCTGNYSLTVTDTNNCSASGSATILQGAGLVVSLTNTGIGCNHPDTTTLTISGGLSFSYFIDWIDGSTSNWVPSPVSHIYTNPGIYNISVQDSLGCGLTVADTVVDLMGYGYYVYVSSTNAICDSNGTATANASGGLPPYTYLWNTVPAQTTAIATGLAGGTYSVIVTDSAGCTRTGFAYVENTCSNTISGIIFDDVNHNCIQDSGESPMRNVYLSAYGNGVAYYGNSNASGNYDIQVSDSGTYVLNVYGTGEGGLGCSSFTPCTNDSVTFNGMGLTASNYNFAFSGPGTFDFRLHPGWSPANPGFQKRYWIFYYNQYSQTYHGSATVIFAYDSNLTYTSCDIPLPVHDALAHTLTWNVDSVGRFGYPYYLGQCRFTVSPTVPAGYYLQSDFYINPTAGDCSPGNNHEHFSELVTSSMDPNEKEVLPEGNIVEEDSVLTYTIHFQNTGTDTTWFIILKDTLDENVDPMAVRNLASSHSYTEFTVSGTGILTWLFNPIFLVDSATNEPASKGFVMFSVKKKPGLPIGTSISNKASIYFDYNVPVVTNTVQSTITDPSYIFSIAGDGISVMAFPNPFSNSTSIVVEGLKDKFDLSLFDVTGRMLKNISSIAINQFELKREELSAGVYFYKLTVGDKRVANGKLVVE